MCVYELLLFVKNLKYPAAQQVRVLACVRARVYDYHIAVANKPLSPHACVCACACVCVCVCAYVWLSYRHSLLGHWLVCGYECVRASKALTGISFLFMCGLQKLLEIVTRQQYSSNRVVAFRSRCMCIRIHSHPYMHAHLCTHKHTHTHAPIYMRTHAPIYMRTHAPNYTELSTYARTHMQANACSSCVIFTRYSTTWAQCTQHRIKTPLNRGTKAIPFLPSLSWESGYSLCPF